MKKGLMRLSLQLNCCKTKKLVHKILMRTLHTPCIQQDLMKSPVHSLREGTQHTPISIPGHTVKFTLS